MARSPPVVEIYPGTAKWFFRKEICWHPRNWVNVPIHGCCNIPWGQETESRIMLILVMATLFDDAPDSAGFRKLMIRISESWDIFLISGIYCFLKNERGFQRQPTIFQNEKRAPGAKKYNLKRYLRTVGLGIKTPLEVIGCRKGFFKKKSSLSVDWSMWLPKASMSCFFLHFCYL